jgi:hypothetical protein
VSEVEREDRQIVALGVGHHRRVDEPEVEIGVAGVELDGAGEETRRRTHDRERAGERCLQQLAGGRCSSAPSQYQIGLDQHRLRDQQGLPQ